MSREDERRVSWKLWGWEQAPLVFFAVVLVGFSFVADGFLSWPNLRNLFTQAAAVGILAVGLTFVLLLGRVDLSVGAVMVLSGAVGGKVLQAGGGAGVAVAGMVAVALAVGALNGWMVARWRVVSFAATLATLYLGRGWAHWLTQTRPLPVPPFEVAGGWVVAGVGVPIVAFALTVAVAHGVLRHTAFGLQLYALGADGEAARRAGLPAGRITMQAFLVSSFCAFLATAVALTQSPTVSPEFGSGLEFTAIAAAVIGGVSLFGGEGRVFPGVVLGAVLMQMVSNGLNILNVDPYLYPIILGGVIFLAVLTDSRRNRALARLNRRKIRIEPTPDPISR